MARPFTRSTWDNAALIAPATAARLGIKNEAVPTIGANGHSRRRLWPLFLYGLSMTDYATRRGWPS
jgi:hypothetical protein